MRRHLIFSLLFLFGTSIGWGQKYSFVTYSTEEGLPQSQVTCISQDNDGYLWVGTLGGLAKFNGGDFITFSSLDGLLNNRIKTLSFFNNALWVGHDGGISIIENKKIRSVEFEGKDKSRGVSSILSFKGKTLIACNGGGLFELVRDKLVQVKLPAFDHERIRGAVVYGGKVFLATKLGVLSSSDGVHYEQYSKVSDMSFSGIFVKDHYMYLTTYRDGLIRINMDSGINKTFAFDDFEHIVLGGYADRSGQVWLNSGRGIIRIDTNDQITTLGFSSGLPLEVISCFFEDAEGNFWMGSEGKGIFRFPGEAFRYFDKSEEFPSSLFLTGFQKPNGNFYLGTYDKGLISINPMGKIKNIFSVDMTVWCSVMDVDGLDWFGTHQYLISIDEKGKMIMYDNNENIPGRVTSFYRVSDSEMYIGGARGVTHYKNGVFRYLNKKDDKQLGTVRDFVMYKNELYCASNLGVFIYRNRKFEPLKGLEYVVYNMEIDEESNIWFGTEEGLFKYNGISAERVSLSKRPSSNYIGFLNYRNKQLYVGTNNGLFVLSNLNDNIPKSERFGLGEGLVDLETNLNSGFFDRSGKFWFGTASGLVSFDPAVPSNKSKQPLLELKSILLNYQPFNYSDYSKELDSKGFPTRLRLPASKNNLIFELDGISLSSHSGLTYQFLLEGLSEKWSPLSENQTITFTNLPAGEYTLRMRSVDVDGRISKEIYFPFVVLPAFYRTWWFMGLCALLIVLIVIGLFRLRLRRINEINEKEKLEFKARLLQLEQQSMNASMNRHFVFNSLNSIQYFINTQDRVSANKYLTSFAKLIRKNLDSATSDGNVITLQEELERLELYLSLESMRFKDRFDYEINAQGIDTESIRIPAMILQPFIENSIIHGILPNEDKKGTIRIDIIKDSTNLIISMEDNGIGISHSLSQKHHFEGDHQSKGMEITSKRIELIQKVSNNQIILEGPYEFSDNNRSIKGTRVLLKIPLEDLDI